MNSAFKKILICSALLIALILAIVSLLSDKENGGVASPEAEAFAVIGEWLYGDGTFSEAVSYASEYAFGLSRENDFLQEAGAIERP